MTEDKEHLPVRAKETMKMILTISESLMKDLDKIDNMIPKRPLRSELEKVHEGFKIKLKSLKEEVKRLRDWVLFLEDMRARACSNEIQKRIIDSSK